MMERMHESFDNTYAGEKISRYDNDYNFTFGDQNDGDCSISCHSNPRHGLSKDEAGSLFNIIDADGLISKSRCLLRSNTNLINHPTGACFGEWRNCYSVCCGAALAGFSKVIATLILFVMRCYFVIETFRKDYCILLTTRVQIQ